MTSATSIAGADIARRVRRLDFTDFAAAGFAEMGAPHGPQKTTAPSHSVPHAGHLVLTPLTSVASPGATKTPDSVP